MKSFLFYIKHPYKVFFPIFIRIGWSLPDELYIRMLFFLKLGKFLNLKNPQTFSEKIQWLKLYDKKDQYTQLVDKFLVKKYVADIIGEEFIIPTLGLWKNPDEIDFNSLPNQFVLKTTHGGGNTGVVVCKDKSNLDVKRTKKKLYNSLKQDIYRSLREWPYKNVNRRILAETFIGDDFNTDLEDYKFFCFSGIAKYCQVISNRSTNKTIDFFDRNWIHQPFTGLSETAKHAPNICRKIESYEKMLEIADKIASAVNSPFIRVDLYNTNNKIYFGEITFYPASGLGKFSPTKWNEKIGQELNLCIKSN